MKEWRNLQDRYVETPLNENTEVPPPADTQEPKPAQAASTPQAEAKVDLPSELPAEALSQGAIDKRLRRIFTPRADGSFLVSPEFVKQYQQRGQERDKLLVMFEKCNYDPDWVWGFSTGVGFQNSG